MLGDIYTRPQHVSEATWLMLFNVINPRWTDIPLFSHLEIAALSAGAKR